MIRAAELLVVVTIDHIGSGWKCGNWCAGKEVASQ